MIRGSAASVSERGPPASCRSTIDPAWAWPSTLPTIASVPGSVQSFGSTSQTMLSRSRRRAVFATAASMAPPGGRNRQGDEPVAASMAADVRLSSASAASCERLVIGLWSQVWLPIAWPAASVCRASRG